MKTLLRIILGLLFAAGMIVLLVLAGTMTIIPGGAFVVLGIAILGLAVFGGIKLAAKVIK